MPALSPLSFRTELGASAAAMTPSSSLSPLYIVGFVVAGVVIVGIAAWLGIRTYRKRAAAKRENLRGAAFLSVRGLVKEGEDEKSQHEKEPLPEHLQAIQGSTFSRDFITPSIVLPEKAITNSSPATPNDILDYHRASGNFPRPFAPRPFSFALNAGGSQRSSTLNPDSARDRSSRSSFMSFASSSRFSVISSSSTVSATPSTGHARKVRQVFTPVLPDELLITQVGERLTVVESFDDGWCVVGRENGSFASTAKSMFKSSSGTTPQTDVELGVVPAWCFLKPVKGLRAERPIRSTSLGITVQMESGFSSRDEVISWSNF